MESSSTAPQLQTAQHFIFVTQVYFCSMYAVVLWDWVISLSREWRYVWKTHWTPVKFAYLFCRYWVIAVVPYLLYCFAMDHSKETCLKIYRIPVALAMWNQVGSESVLLIRTYAFFNRNVYVLMFLLAAMTGVVAYQLYVDTSQMLLLPFVTPPFEKGPCLPMSKPRSAHLLGFFIAPLLFDTLVTVMTVWKAFTIRRRNGGPNSRLIQTFLREGVFYYILISVANLINGIFYLQPRQVISAINIPLSVMLGPILACRLILDLRERGSETISHSEGTGIAFTTKNGSPGSPFTAHHRSKHSSAMYRSHARGITATVDSNIMLSTLGSIVQDTYPTELASDVKAGAGQEVQVVEDSDGLESFGTRTEDEGQDKLEESPTPDYDAVELEMGFRTSRPSYEAPRQGVSGIRIDVEKASSSTM